jgi:hypothetical protein
MTFNRRAAVIELSFGGAFLLPALFGNGWRIGLSPKFGDFQILGAVLGVVCLLLGWMSWGLDSREGADRRPGEKASS